MNYFQPDETGFFLRTYSWAVLKDPPGPTKNSSVGKTIYREEAASEYARHFFPEIASNTKLECADRKLFKRNLIQAAEQNQILRPKSWQLEGTYSKTGKRPQTISSDWEEAVKMLQNARRVEAGLSGKSTHDLISLERAREVVSIEEKLTKYNWKLPQLVELGERVKFDPNLPDITIPDAVTEYLAWANAQTKVPKSTKNPRPKISPQTYKDHRRSLNMVVRYFKSTDPLMKLMDKATVQAFCEGSDDIPLSEAGKLKEEQARRDGKAVPRRTERPWRRPTKVHVASAIIALLKWASTPGIPHQGGAKAYLPVLNEDDFWFPEKEEDNDNYLKDAKTATPYEYRAWIDTAWPTQFATQVALETFAGLRPAEIHAPDSYINWEECYFWVGRSCKTGHRKVPLSDNLMIMLFVLKLEGRLDLACEDRRTVLHAEMGYKISENSLKYSSPDPESFRQEHPLRYHKVTNKSTGKDEYEPWGYWTPKCPRHTFGSVVYEASMGNAGVTTGLLGHRESTFLDAYAGKVHAELWHGSIYRACLSFVQCLPKQLRALGLREKDMRKPAWFLIQPDDRKGENRNRLLNLVNSAYDNADPITRRQVAAVRADKTFVLTKVDLAARMGIDVSTIRHWEKNDDFPHATANGYVLEDIKQWASARGLPRANSVGTRNAHIVKLPDGTTGYRLLWDLAKALDISETTLAHWRKLPGFPGKSGEFWVYEQIKTWAEANDLPHPRYGHGRAVVTVGNKTIFKMRKDLLNALGIADPTLRAWEKINDFPGRSGIGWVFQDIEAWARANGRKVKACPAIQASSDDTQSGQASSPSK